MVMSDTVVMLDAPGRPAPIQCGRSFGKYRIVRELGRGGMGVVYLAEDTSLGRMVALKSLYPALAMDAEFIERFRAEARYVAAWAHPGIVRIHSFEEIEGHATIDMEYVDGDPLSELMLHEVMTPHLVVSLIRSVVQALAECHAEGIVHRDVKPANILVGRNGRVLLTDFGLAKAYAHHLESMVRSTSSSGFFLGTPHYAPPEAWGSGVATPAWDVYSLGMVMYESMSGRLVYDGSTPLEIMRQMVSAPPKPICELVPKISESLGALVDDLLNRDPTLRPADAGAVLERLRRVPEYDLRGIDPNSTVHIPKHRRKWWRQTARHVPRPRGFVKGAVTGALVLACAVAAVWYELLGKPDGDVLQGRAAGVASQEGLGRTHLLSADEMLALPQRAKSAGRSFFDVRFLEKDSGLDALWMLVPGETVGDETIVAVTDRGIYRLSMKTNAEDAFDISGDVAEYAQPSGQYCREARVQGKGRWVPRGVSMSFQLELTDTSDNTLRRLAAMGTRSSKEACDTRFLYELEESPTAMPLLYLELLPKNREWARKFEALLPAVFGARLQVPCLAGDTPIAVDGNLNEAAWQRAYYAADGRIGACFARPETVSAKLLAVATSKGLYLAFRLPGKNRNPIGLQLGVMPSISIPAKSSAQALAVWQPGTSPETRLMVEDHDTPWNCDWQWAFASDAGLWTAEVLIPSASLRDMAMPRPGNVWRLNASLVACDTAAQLRPVCQWGYPDFDDVLHGMIVQFVSGDSQP
jgi:predicted Ser/Thr protein kinase